MAFAAIVGHVFPIWFGFRGGKGGATAAGLVLYLASTVGIAVIGVWLVVLALTGFVGLATISGGLAAVALVGLTLLPAEPGLLRSRAAPPRSLSIRIAATSAGC